MAVQLSFQNLLIKCSVAGLGGSQQIGATMLRAVGSSRLEQQVAELKAALARKEAMEAGKPVPPIVRARRPSKRW
jgi:hypothetical protein